MSRKNDHEWQKAINMMRVMFQKLSTENGYPYLMEEISKNVFESKFKQSENLINVLNTQQYLLIERYETIRTDLLAKLGRHRNERNRFKEQYDMMADDRDFVVSIYEKCQAEYNELKINRDYISSCYHVLKIIFSCVCSMAIVFGYWPRSLSKL